MEKWTTFKDCSEDNDVAVGLHLREMLPPCTLQYGNIASSRTLTYDVVLRFADGAVLQLQTFRCQERRFTNTENSATKRATVGLFERRG